MDPGLDENEAELGVAVLAVALQVLADADGLLDLKIKLNDIFKITNLNNYDFYMKILH